MNRYKDTVKDIERTVGELYNLELIRDYHPSSIKKTGPDSGEISMSHHSDANNILFDKHLSAEEIIYTLLENQQYTVLLYDKAIIQVEFTFENNEVTKERLLFIKKHNRIWKPKEIKDADEEDSDWFQDEKGIPVFIRFDFDLKNHRECCHPISHLTISNYDSCRIPIKNAVSFSEFVKFIVRHFYSINMEFDPYRFNGEPTITELESIMMHINWK